MVDLERKRLPLRIDRVVRRSRLYEVVAPLRQAIACALVVFRILAKRLDRVLVDRLGVVMRAPSATAVGDEPRGYAYAAAVFGMLVVCAFVQVESHLGNGRLIAVVIIVFMQLNLAADNGVGHRHRGSVALNGYGDVASRVGGAGHSSIGGDRYLKVGGFHMPRRNGSLLHRVGAGRQADYEALIRPLHLKTGVA